jgi:hypothetical protein
MSVVRLRMDEMGEVVAAPVTELAFQFAVDSDEEEVGLFGSFDEEGGVRSEGVNGLAAGQDESLAGAEGCRALQQVKEA